MSGTIATSTAIDLSRLPPPDLIEPLDYETVLAALLAEAAARLPDIELLESDAATKILQIAAFREVLLRQRVNDSARAVLLAYAGGGDLDNIAALFGVERRELVPANPETGSEVVMEIDDDLRRRVLLAPDSYSVAGPASAYVFHALSAHGDVLDASATSPAPGEVVVSVLSRLGDGTADPALVAAVEAVLGADHVRPLTDAVTVQSAEIVPFQVDAQLMLYPGPDAQLIRDTAEARLVDLLASNRRIGRDITRSAIIAALHTGGVQNVVLLQPAADVAVSDVQAGHASSISVQVAGTAV